MEDDQRGRSGDDLGHVAGLDPSFLDEMQKAHQGFLAGGGTDLSTELFEPGVNPDGSRTVATVLFEEPRSESSGGTTDYDSLAAQASADRRASRPGYAGSPGSAEASADEVRLGPQVLTEAEAPFLADPGFDSELAAAIGGVDSGQAKTTPDGLGVPELFDIHSFVGPDG